MASRDTLLRRLTLRELRLILAVARSGSILKAASEVGLSQPALSKSVAQLESTLGAKIFDRNNRGVSPTPQGAIVLRHASGVFEELRQAADELELLRSGDRGELRVGGTPTMCAGLLARSVGALLGRGTNLRIHVAELELERLVGEVLSRSLDLAISREPGGVDADLLFDHLFDDRLFVVCGARHPLASSRSVSLQEVARCQWALPGATGAMVGQLRAEFRRHNLELPAPMVSTMSVPARFQLVAGNRLLTVMYGSVLRFGNTPRFARVLPVDIQTGIPIGILRLRNRTLAPSADLFTRAVRSLTQPMRALRARQLARET